MRKSPISLIALAALLINVLPMPTVHAADQPSCCCTGMMQSGAAMPSMMDKCQAMMARNLGPADANYDRRFIDAMIQHHQDAVEMAQDALQKAHHPALKQAAQKIITDQSSEIQQFQRWRKQWYGE